MAFIELWNRWSDGRKDTRTQPTGTFEHFYDGDGRKIGYILSDPVGDHTLALYSAWSDSRKDSRLQVSAERLPEYGSNIELVGYIYKPPRNGESPRFGTVPLYRAYNSHRQDSRTQVEPGFEPGYENREVLGYIPSHEIVLEKINFDQLDLDSQLIQHRPKHVHAVTFSNNTSAAQQQKFSFEDSQTNSHTFSTTNSFTSGLQVSVESTEGVPDTVQMKESMSVSLSATHTSESTRQHTETISKSYEFPLTIPANKTVRAQATLYVQSITLPYTATLKLVGTNTTHNFEGVYHGVHTSDAVVELSEIPPLI